MEAPATEAESSSSRPLSLDKDSGTSMASPFHIFRKHQKALMAVAALFAIIAFVFLDPRITEYFFTRGTADKVMVRSDYGNLRESQVRAGLQTATGSATFSRRWRGRWCWPAATCRVTAGGSWRRCCGRSVTPPRKTWWMPGFTRIWPSAWA